MPVTPWTTPRTWAGGILQPAHLNVDVRDNQNFLYSPPRVKVNNDFDTVTSGGTTITAGGGTAAQFSSEEYDNDGMHSTLTNISRVEVKTAGYWSWVADVEFGANATGSREAAIRLNGNNVVRPFRVGAAPATGNTSFQVCLHRFFLVGDYLELLMWHDAGVNLSVLALLEGHWMSN